MIYPLTFYNVSSSWYYDLTSCHEHSFKNVSFSQWSPIHQQFENGMTILNTRYYFFTLPNTLDDYEYVHMLQQETCLYDIQDLDPEDITEWKR